MSFKTTKEQITDILDIIAQTAIIDMNIFRLKNMNDIKCDYFGVRYTDEQKSFVENKFCLTCNDEFSEECESLSRECCDMCEHLKSMMNCGVAQMAVPRLCKDFCDFRTQSFGASNSEGMGYSPVPDYIEREDEHGRIATIPNVIKGARVNYVLKTIVDGVQVADKNIDMLHARNKTRVKRRFHFGRSK